MDLGLNNLVVLSDGTRALPASLRVEPRLGKWGVAEEDIRVMSRNAMLDHCHPRNPRACTVESMTGLYREAL